jgi:outer membrane protein TolC
VGSKTRYDLIKAQLDLANARMDLISASNSVSDARAQLNSLLGLAEDPAYDVVTSPPGDYKPDFTNLVAKAGRDHPDMRKLQAQALIASAEVDSAIADLFPDIGLSGRYSGSGADFPLTWNWSAGVDAALSLFTGWRKTAAIDIAVAELRIARASVAGKEQGLYLELRRAMNQLMAARRKLDLAGMAARQARENSELLQERYKVGSATAVELTDAQVSLTRAMSAQVNARFDYEAAWAQMLHLTGEER